MEMTPIAATAFAGLLERATGQELIAGRRWRIETALGPVMRAHGIDGLDKLAVTVRRAADPRLSEEVVEALLNNETFFFRDVAAFQTFAGEALDAMANARATERRLRIWSAGCSTGQEAYSVALAIQRKPERWAGWDISILGTDVSRYAVARAREGLYSQFEIQRGLPIGEMIANFDAEGESWRARPGLRARVRFRQHNLLDASPPGPFDMILCRNVLLYFAAGRRAQVFDRLARAIAPDGILMLGAGETALGQTDAFASDRELRGLYRPVARAT